MKNISKYPCPQDPIEALILKWYSYRDNEKIEENPSTYKVKKNV